MDIEELTNIWNQKYKNVPMQLEKVKQINTVATAFNTNIDAILKIDGNRLKELLSKNDIPVEELINIKQTSFRKPEDVLVGIVKCFSLGIAEEWVTEDVNIYSWMDKVLGYNHLQMGGQGGIIANVLGLLGVKKVVAHTNSHPEQQAQQFLDLDNLLGFDDKGNLLKAKDIFRKKDIPLIHWIIEFNKGDGFTYQGKEFVCPRSNRFIATYDPLNTKLKMDSGFISFLNENKVDYLFLSGFHPLLEKNDGINHIKRAVDVLQSWKKSNPEMITHLEIASVQDKVIRKEIIEKIAPLVQSIGLNERETIDSLEVIGQEELAHQLEKESNSTLLLKALLYLKNKLKVSRIQLHTLGLYLTLQDTSFPYSPQMSLDGMMTAAVVSASKAYHGELAKYEDITRAYGMSVSPHGIKELKDLSQSLGKEELLKTGICDVENYMLCAIPTIIVDKPKTLVGMGDTISSISLLATR